MTDEADKQAAELFRRIANDPRTRRQQLKLIKEVDPNQQFWDDDLNSKLEAIDAKVEKDKADREEQKIIDRLTAQKKALGERYKPEQIAEIEKLMTEHGIGDYNIGAKVYAADQPLPDARPVQMPRQGERWKLPEMEDFRKDPAGAAIAGAMADIERLRSGALKPY